MVLRAVHCVLWSLHVVATEVCTQGTGPVAGGCGADT